MSEDVNRSSCWLQTWSKAGPSPLQGRSMPLEGSHTTTVRSSANMYERPSLGVFIQARKAHIPSFSAYSSVSSMARGVLHRPRGSATIQILTPELMVAVVPVAQMLRDVRNPRLTRARTWRMERIAIEKTKRVASKSVYTQHIRPAGGWEVSCGFWQRDRNADASSTPRSQAERCHENFCFLYAVASRRCPPQRRLRSRSALTNSFRSIHQGAFFKATLSLQ